MRLKISVFLVKISFSLYRMKLSVTTLCLLFIFSTTSFAQKSEFDTVRLYHSIVDNGYFLMPSHQYKECLMCDPAPGIDIYSDSSSSVYSMSTGIVQRVFSVTGSDTVLMINEDSVFYVYNGLRGVTIKNGDSVKLGQ